MATNYQRGAQFEYRVMNLLRENGYYVCRSAGSKGPADLIAIPEKQKPDDNTSVLFVQCKKGGKLPKTEKESLCFFCIIYGGIPILAEKGKDGVKFTNLENEKDATERLALKKESASEQRRQPRPQKIKRKSGNKV